MSLNIAIVGAGFGGTYAARELLKLRRIAHTQFTIDLYEPRKHFIFTPLLHEVATAALALESVVIPYKQILKNQDVVTHIEEKVSFIDFKTRTILAKKKRSYDYLILSPGAQTNYFGNVSIKKNSLPLKSDTDAMSIRFAIEEAILKAAKARSIKECKKNLTFSIIGGGPTGIELAGEIGQFVQQRIQMQYGMLKGAKADVLLLQAAPTLVPFASHKVQETAEKKLRKLGVTVKKNTTVTTIKNKTIYTAKDRFYSEIIIWVAGIAPSMVSGNLDEKECTRYYTNNDLSLKEHQEVFALGDASSYRPKLKKTPTPALAQAAVQQAKLVARNVISRINDRPTKPFAFHSKGFLMSIGQKDAVAELYTPFGTLFFTGFFAWWLWRTIYLFKYMNAAIEFRTAAYWTVQLFTGRDLKPLKRSKSRIPNP